jgi:hypothetical protein
MPRIEVEEADYNAAAGVTSVVQQMMNNPVSRKMLLQARKVVNPNVSIPEIDQAAPINEAVTQVHGELNKLRAELAERDRLAAERETMEKFNAKWEGQAAQLRSAGWRAAGIEAVKTFAEENGIADLSIAADAWQARNPAPPASTTSGGMFGLFGGGNADKEDTYVQDLMKSGGPGGLVDESLVDREIRAALADARANR